MIDVHFVILGALFTVTGSTSYVIQTVRGRTQPNRVTWFMWAAAPLLAFAVEIQYGVGLRSLMTFMVGISPLAVFIASFVNPSAKWQIGPFDLACGALSAAGTIGWLVTRTGLVALGASIAADLVAGVPTLLKAWRAPETETSGAYLGATANAAITLLTVQHFTAAEVAFPLYILAIGVVLVALVAGRLGPRLRRRRQGSRYLAGFTVSEFTDRDLSVDGLSQNVNSEQDGTPRRENLGKGGVPAANRQPGRPR